MEGSTSAPSQLTWLTHLDEYFNQLLTCMVGACFAAVQELGLEGVYADGTTAAALNSNALQAALAAVRPAMADRYRTSGWQLNFATDMLVSDNNAEAFIREGAMKFAPEQQDESSSGRGVVQVTSPVLTSKSVGEVRKMAAAGKPENQAMMLAAADDPYMVRFLGNWYTKVCGGAVGVLLGCCNVIACAQGV